MEAKKPSPTEDGSSDAPSEACSMEHAEPNDLRLSQTPQLRAKSEHEHKKHATTTPQQPRQRHTRTTTRTTTPIHRSPARSIVSSIVIQQTEETLQVLRSNLQCSSAELMRTLGQHLSQLSSNNGASQRQHPMGGISLPASAVAWLALSMPENTSNFVTLLPRLTHLRITNAPWPTKTKNSTSNIQPQGPPASIRQQYASLQFFHRLRYNPTVDLAIFPNLQVLLLDEVPPDWAVHLSSLALSLQVLRVERAYLHDLESFLFDYDSDEDSTSVFLLKYTKLTHLKLSRCNMGEKNLGLTPTEGSDNSVYNQQTPESSHNLPLARMPSLKSLSLSHNSIRSERAALACGISHATCLSTLDLGYNEIPSMIHSSHYIGNLQVLILTGNRIESAEGLDRLYGLQTLALDHNCIQTWIDVAGLARLPELKVLKLKGNPFMETVVQQKHARVMLLDVFRDRRWSSLTDGVETTNSNSTTNNKPTFRQLEVVLPVIDDKPASERELKALQQRAFSIVATAPVFERRLEMLLDHGDAILTVNVNETAECENHQETDSTASVRRSRNPLLPQNGHGTLTRTKRKASKAIITEEQTENGFPASVRPWCRPGKGTSSESAIVPGTGRGEENEQVVNQTPLTTESGAEQRWTPPAPKLSFGITDLFSSLDPQPISSTKSDDSCCAAVMRVQNGTQNAATQVTVEARRVALSDQPEEDDGEVEEKTSPTPDFEWPEPLPYLPKQNLYPEFEWKIETTISLSDQGETLKKKRQTRNGKGARPQEHHRKKPPAITTDTSETAENDSSKTSSSAVEKPSPSGTDTNRSVGTSSITPGSQVSVDVQLAAKASSGRALLSPRAWVKADESGLNALAESATGSQSAASNTKRRTPLATSSDLRSISSDSEDGMVSPNRRISGASFPAMAMDGVDDATCSTIGTNKSGGTNSLRGPSRLDKFHLAEIKSKFLGMEQERKLEVLTNLELYFKIFVFPDFVPNIDLGQLDAGTEAWQTVFFRYPRIQLSPKDRDLRAKIASNDSSVIVKMNANGGGHREQLVTVWRENVVSCGKPALRRLPPNRTAHFGFHGDLTWNEGKLKTVSQCRTVIICLSTTTFYIILDHDNFTARKDAPTVMQDGADLSQMTKSLRKSRKFPSPIPPDAVFEQALWPHAVACHPLSDIQGITIGFGFQRLTLRIRNSAYPSAVDYTYTLLTSNKIKTVKVLKELQSLVKDATLEMGQPPKEETIKIDNDDRVFLDTLAAAVAPRPLGIILHYQILSQKWKHGQRGAVTRACVVTDKQILLLDEEYVGDGSVSLDAEIGRRLATPTFRLIDSADLQQISEVKAADADPNAVTIIIQPSEAFSRPHRWRLLCRDRNGAEKLVDDVRKGKELVA